MSGIGETSASYDRVAERYAKEIGGELAGKPVDRALYALFAELVRDLCAQGRVVGDIGCGPGHVSGYLAGFGVPMLGLDVSPGMIKIARRQFPDISFDVGAFDDLPAGDGQWAGAVAAYSMIHLDRDERRVAAAELARAITPGGWLLVGFHTSDDQHPMGGVQHVTDWWGKEVDLDFHYLDPAEVTGDLGEAGFALRVRTDREPWPLVEHQSRRSYLLAERVEP